MISICIPVYNGAHYIGETLESLSRQTYDNFEIIVSDNASTDETETIVKSFSSKFKRFKYSRNQRNIGYSANVSKAVSISESDIVAIYHADDIYHPDILIREFEVMQSNPEIAGVFSRSKYFRDLGAEDEDASLPSELKEYVPFNPLIKMYSGGMDEFGPALLRFGNFFVCPSFMTKKKLFLNLGGFTNQYPANEDLHLWIRYLDAGHSLAIIDEPLIRYRISETQGSAALRKHIDLSLSFTVLDDLLVEEYGTDVGLIYNERKANDLLDAAINAFRLGCFIDALACVMKSRKICQLKHPVRKVLAQRYPILVIPVAAIRAFLQDWFLKWKKK